MKSGWIAAICIGSLAIALAACNQLTDASSTEHNPSDPGFSHASIRFKPAKASPPKRVIPPAVPDYVVDRSYTYGNAELTLEGFVHISGEEIQTWDLDRRSVPALRAVVEREMERPNGTTSWFMRIAQKETPNERVIFAILRVTKFPVRGKLNLGLNSSSVGLREVLIANLLEEPTSQDWTDLKKPKVYTYAVAVKVPPQPGTTAFMVGVYEERPRSYLLEPKIGGSIKHQQHAFRIKSIEEAHDDKGRRRSMERAWRITMERPEATPGEIWPYLEFVNSAGEKLIYINSDGRTFTQEETSAAIEKFVNSPAFKPNPQFDPLPPDMVNAWIEASGTGWSLTAEAYFSTVDPTKMPFMRARGATFKVVKFRTIPLYPMLGSN